MTASTIKKVTCHVVSAPVERPFTSSRGWLYKTRGSCIVEIETSDGIVGWGECYGPSAVAKAFIDTQFAPRIIGRDAFDVEVIWEDLYNRIKDYGTTGMAISALSGIDIALWDIVGKSVNKPIHKLIGGAYRTEVTCYATGLYFIDMNRLVEEAVEEAREFAEEGFQAIKMKIGLGDPKLDIRRVAAVREAIGDNVRLMVDANHCFTVPQAIRIGRELEKLDIEWFEEPISPEDVDGYMDIVQPDVCAAGGISECRKIATLAITHGVECVPHAWGSAIGVAATLHFLAALPDQPPSYRPMPPMLEFEQCENPFRDYLSREPIVQHRGKVQVPTGAGLGIEIDRTVLDKYRVG
ncbi:MAG: rhamnonate dehydratase [Ramlibacter sp.]|nr:rhamnonate dehydratase [Ramlibacter sp.]